MLDCGRPKRSTTTVRVAYLYVSKNQDHCSERAVVRAAGGSGWHLHVDGSDDAPWAEWFLTSSCLALAVLLAERQAPPGGFCRSPSCGRPFVNVGRGSARRYCSAACGTRERVAAHREARDSPNQAAAP
jgi:predicted RNA-binding Zn ribbon-like protein